MSDLAVRSQRAARRTAADRREAIITAARSLFARQGFHGTGMAEIAHVSDVLVGQIYRDFARKEDIIAAIVESDVTQLLDDPEIAGSIAVGNVDQLNSWLRRFIGRKLDDETRNILANMLAEAGRNPRIAALVMGAHVRLRDRLALPPSCGRPSQRRRRHAVSSPNSS